MTTTVTPKTPATPESPETALAPRKWKTPILLGVFALVSLLIFSLRLDPSLTTRIDLNSRTVPIELPPLVLPSMLTNLILSTLMIAFAAYTAKLAYDRKKIPMWGIALFAALWVIALIVWVGAGANVPFVWLLTGTLAISTPLVFGSMAGLVSERAGVVNIAIEGQLLAGAFASALVSSMTGSWVAGILAALVAGVLVSVVLALFSITYWVEQVVVGVVINMIVIGLTSYLYSGLMASNRELYNSPDTYDAWPIPLLSSIPIIGPVFFSHSIITYLMFILVPLLTWALFNTRWGLRTRSVGEHPKAADTVGINVNRNRWFNVLLSGAIAGVGGSFYTLGSVGAFNQEVTSGQGYIALAALIFGRWHPVYATLAALLFGFASNFRTLATQVGANVPSELLSMVPYIVTVLAVIGFVGQSRGPAASGVPYIK
ncbi:ABC transporter permease [Gulosibacter molinativorax]|uniref:ABC transporter permease n=1 Tax=Gulosibacter molinativorax TaxID=256821 RepID=A0ABT7C861_9MICO|nr:ABC transporter permease [Gulosibacter molinativorax]MDJ1371347.1 ABC transporter permease [Gulosibacter molinativorax]QUY63589.1 Putative ABC transporter permease protein YufQ [Gulosibacter molinativorax]